MSRLDDLARARGYRDFAALADGDGDQFAAWGPPESEGERQDRQELARAYDAAQAERETDETAHWP